MQFSIGNIGEWVRHIQAGDRLALSKAITLAESEALEHQALRNALLEQIELLGPATSFRLAVTGVPGAGKSTFIDWLGMQWIEDGHKVAVLAIDPSSGLSQGSVLGDKTRMASLAPHPSAFVRPSPTRLQLGGVASTTFETLLLCEAAGFERIIVETVGVGQNETIASQLTDACLLLLVTGTGDDLQGVKKGILESADCILVNKADGRNTDMARAFARELKSLSSLWPTRANGQKAQVFTGSAEDKAGLPELLAFLNNFYENGMKTGWLAAGRTKQKSFWLDCMLQHQLQLLFTREPALKTALEDARQRILFQNQPVSSTVAHLVEIVRKK